MNIYPRRRRPAFSYYTAHRRTAVCLPGGVPPLCASRSVVVVDHPSMHALVQRSRRHVDRFDPIRSDL